MDGKSVRSRGRSDPRSSKVPPGTPHRYLFEGTGTMGDFTVCSSKGSTLMSVGVNSRRRLVGMDSTLSLSLRVVLGVRLCRTQRDRNTRVEKKTHTPSVPPVPSRLTQKGSSICCRSSVDQWPPLPP